MKEEIWDEFEVVVERPDGLKIPLCGLCGNSGRLDTTNSAKWNGQKVGLRSYCICPNGRALKKSYDKE